MASPSSSTGGGSWIRSFDQNGQPVYNVYDECGRCIYTVPDIEAQGVLNLGAHQYLYHQDNNNNNPMVNDNIPTASGTYRIWCDVEGCTNREGFTRTGDLRRHKEAVHQGVKQFHCGCCMNANTTYGSSRKDHIKQHIRKKHKKQGDVQWYQLNDCGTIVQLGFSSKRCLAEHKHKYHYNISSPTYPALIGKS